MTNWQSVLLQIAPAAPVSRIADLSETVPAAVARFDLSTPLRQAHFFSQWAEETAGFSLLSEESSGEAYEGRRDLGNTQPGDGRRFKGRGLCMLTGRANYHDMSKQLVIDFVSHPEIVATVPHALNVAGVYWRERCLNSFADRDDILEITRRINGGLNGLALRRQYLARAKVALR